MMPRACLSVTRSIAVMPANIPLSSHLVDECSAGSQSTGASSRWISSLVIAPFWIDSDQPAEPLPPLTEPSEDIIAVLLAMAVVKSTAWSQCNALNCRDTCQYPASSHLIDDCSAGSQSTGAAPCWISVLVIIPVWIARDQPAEP